MKLSTYNQSIELQNQLNLFSNIPYTQHVNSDNVIQVDNTLNFKPAIADSKKKESYKILMDIHLRLYLYTN